MSILVCGSVAYDNIMVFQGHFKDHILSDKTHMINVSFFSPQMRKEFGGCAGNIAYNLNLLGLKPEIVAAVGSDFNPYQQHLDRLGISSQLIAKHQDAFCAQCFITTDLDDNQIASFHPGAMQLADKNTIPNKAADNNNWELALIGPDSREAMLHHAKTLTNIGVDFIFDPGQALPILSAEDLNYFIDNARWLIANDYEFAMILEKTNLSESEIKSKLEATIITKGSSGSIIHTKNQQYDIASVKVNAVDPTGCGDAYRAGIIYGILNNLDWEKTGNIASLCGAYKVEVAGTQNHNYSKEEFFARLEK